MSYYISSSVVFSFLSSVGLCRVMLSIFILPILVYSCVLRFEAFVFMPGLFLPCAVLPCLVLVVLCRVVQCSAVQCNVV